MTLLTRFLHLLGACAFGLGFLLAIPGVSLAIAASHLIGLAMDRAQAAHDRALNSELP